VWLVSRLNSVLFSALVGSDFVERDISLAATKWQTDYSSSGVFSVFFLSFFLYLSVFLCIYLFIYCTRIILSNRYYSGRN
jgi:hypothetical protein